MIDDFTEYDVKPSDFLNYLRYNGKHFNKKLCEFACKQFGQEVMTKETLESILTNNNIQLSYNIYDLLYIANWCKYIFYGSAIPDEQHFVLFLTDIFNKEYDLIFNRWIADMAKKGVNIDWYEMI